MTSPLKLNNKTSVVSKARIVTGVRTCRNLSLNQATPFAARIHLRENYPATSGRAT